MFDFVRTHTRLLQFLLVLLIFPSFIFFGVQGYSSFVDGSNKTVAEVNGAAIKSGEFDAAHKQQIERMTQQMPGVDVKLLDTPEMRKRSLEGLVQQRVLTVASIKDRLLISDERLKRLFASDPQYAPLRRPDGSVNAEMLAAQGMSSEVFAERLRQDYMLRQVLGGVGDSSFASTAVSQAGVAALLERREIAVQKLDAKDYLSKVQPTDAEVEAYYKAHPAFYKTPESAQIEYVVLDLDMLKKQLSLSDDDLKKYYEENASRYTAAEERRASHILVNAPKDAPAADREKAKAKAQALLEQARKNPGGFAELAKKNSDDPGSAAQGGDLEFFGKGAMTKPFEDAVFSMKDGEIVGPVETEFGYHIIKLTGVRGGTKKPFEAVRAEIVDEVGRQMAQKKFAEAAEQFGNLVYEQSDSLQPAVDKLRLTLSTGVVGREAAPGASGPLASPKLLAAIFGNEVLNNKRNTEAIETGPNQLVSARIVKHQPEVLLPLDAVKDRVLQRVRSEQAAAAARKDGQARVEALKAKAGEPQGAAVAVSRTQPAGQPRQVVEAALRADLSKGATVVGVDLGEQGFAVVQVLKVVDRGANDPDVPRAQPYVAQALAEAETLAYYEALKRRFKTRIVETPSAAASAAK
ncbi:peptidylprolyl isomerase [Ideonella sp. 4Y16]|uniref:peptidylprolyl isomerase n=1 Tax=Ideonella alba TaxID=2824118 RepID=UPI001B36F146|nr:peptidylprolyl isomerase [Ideonella alba]MBQ0942735.1 peptidylprolyl isomerase [Ideonella alba]